MPTLSLMRVEIAMVAVLPSRKTEPFSLISTGSIATHVKGMFVRPLYRSLVLHYYHRKIRLVRFLRELSSTSQLPMYKDSNLKLHFDHFIYDAAQISCLTEPDPEEVEAIRNSCRKGGLKGGRKGGLGGEAFFSMKLAAEALDQVCCDESIVIYVECGATGEDGLQLTLGKSDFAMQMARRLLKIHAPSLDVVTCSALEDLPDVLNSHIASRLVVAGEFHTANLLQEAVHRATGGVGDITIHNTLCQDDYCQFVTSGGDVGETFEVLMAALEMLARNRAAKGLFDSDMQATKGTSPSPSALALALSCLTRPVIECAPFGQSWRNTGASTAKTKRESTKDPELLAYHDQDFAEKRAIVESDEFDMDWDELQRDLKLLGDWPNTIKPKDSEDPSRKVPAERGQRILLALATKMGRVGSSTRGLRSWLLERRPMNGTA